MDIKRLKKLNRDLALEQKAQHGPQHGKAGVIQSKKDKVNCPKKQRKSKKWLEGGE